LHHLIVKYRLKLGLRFVLSNFNDFSTVKLSLFSPTVKLAVIFHSPLHSSDSFNLPPFSFSSRAFSKIFYFRFRSRSTAFFKLNLKFRLSRRRRCQRQVKVYPKKQKPQGVNSKFFGKSFVSISNTDASRCHIYTLNRQ